jgi:uncharacterized protein (TIGR01777 family)
MKVLITGATGLVGKELVSLLLDKGISINYLTTSQDKIQDKENYKGFLWNPDKAEIDKSSILDVDSIIHLAGATISKRWTPEYKKEILDSRVLSTNLLYDTLKHNAHNVTHFIGASATGIYPNSLTKVYSEESTNKDDSFLSTVVQKWEAAEDRISSLNLKVAKIRTGLVLSGEGGVLKELAGPTKLGLGAAFGSGKQIQSWIHHSDLVGIYYCILENQLTGIYNAVAPHPVSQEDLVKTIAEVLGKPYIMPNIPRFAMKLALGEMHKLLFDSQNVSAKKIISSGYQFEYLSLNKAIANCLLH